MDWHQSLFIVSKLVLAAVLGSFIGFERETHGQAAGLRTNVLVCVGSCLLMMLSLHMEELHRHLSAESVVRLDPGRIASYAIASMGFLGAGAIITGKGAIRGLTTAAGLWLVTAIGLAVGAGFLVPAIVGAIISLVMLYGLRHLKAAMPRDEHTVLELKYERTEKPLKHLRDLLAEHGGVIEFVNYRDEIAAGVTTYLIRLKSKADIPWAHIVGLLENTKGIREIKWHEGIVP
jgi:putative Mg2+ transporter-C (MgtC) family protein